MMLNETWRKATKSNNNGACVELRSPAAGVIELRDSKDGGAGPVLTFTHDEIDAFFDGVHKGEFQF